LDDFSLANCSWFAKFTKLSCYMVFIIKYRINASEIYEYLLYRIGFTPKNLLKCIRTAIIMLHICQMQWRVVYLWYHSNAMLHTWGCSGLFTCECKQLYLLQVAKCSGVYTHTYICKHVFAHAYVRTYVHVCVLHKCIRRHVCYSSVSCVLLARVHACMASYR